MRNGNGKKMVAALLSMAMLVTLFFNGVPANAMSENGEVYSQETYDGFDLEWTNNGERDILISATNEEGTVSFQYDENYYRSSKTDSNGNITLFSYDDNGRLVSVQKEGHTLSYQYDTYNLLASIVIDGVTYVCELDDRTVSKLKDLNGNDVVVYQYTEGKVISVLGLNSEGAWVDKSSDSSFVGNLNCVTYNSHYYDKETGWYYCGRYLDVDANRYVDGRTVSSEEITQLINQAKSNVSTYEATIVKVQNLAQELYSTHMQSATYGVDIAYSSGWYSGLSELEKVARTIAGECPYIQEGEKTAAMVIYNRLLYAVDKAANGETNMFCDVISLEGVVTKASQFTALTGASSGGTSNARLVSTLGTIWNYATSYACYLVAGVTYDYFAVGPLIGVSSAYTNQMFFRDWPTFRDSFYDSNGAMYYDGQVYRIFIPGVGAYSSVSEAETAYINQYGDVRKVNVYFAYSPTI